MVALPEGGERPSPLPAGTAVHGLLRAQRWVLVTDNVVERWEYRKKLRPSPFYFSNSLLRCSTSSRRRSPSRCYSSSSLTAARRTMPSATTNLALCRPLSTASTGGV